MHQNMKHIFKPTMTTVRNFFVKRAQTLEKMKKSFISEENFKNGKYMVSLMNTDLVLLDSMTSKLLWVDHSDLKQFNESCGLLRILLNLENVETLVCLFVADIPSVKENSTTLAEKLNGKFVSTPQALFLLENNDVEMLHQAQGLIHFCRKVNYCSFCGSILEMKSPGTYKTCNTCNKSHYPSLSPIAIALIEDKSHSKVLLVEEYLRFPGMYSCVSGFIEPGETFEAGIQREIAEEVGIQTSNIEYITSQHWALTVNQLMLACIATTEQENVTTNDEIITAKWISAEQLADIVNLSKTLKSPNTADVMWVPPPIAVSHTLMEKWLERYHNYSSPNSKL